MNKANIRTIMATGDNALTAISVARDCSIIESESEVFLADTKNEGDKEIIVWKSTKTSRHTLKESVLVPDYRFYEDEKYQPEFFRAVKDDPSVFDRGESFSASVHEFHCR